MGRRPARRHHTCRAINLCECARGWAKGGARRGRAGRGKTSRGNVFNPAHAAGLPQSRRFADGSSEGEPGALLRSA